MNRFLVGCFTLLLLTSQAFASHIHSSRAERAMEQLIGSSGDIETVIATTSVRTPLLIGGTAVGSNITYKSTTGVGTPTGIAHQWTGGTDGATVLATMLNNGRAGFGTAVPSFKLHAFGASSGNDGLVFRSGNTTSIALLQIERNSGSGIIDLRFYEVDAAGSLGGLTMAQGAALTLQPSANQAIIDVVTNFPLVFATNDIERMRIAAGGNVGFDTLVATQLVSLGGNAARTMWMERHTTSNTAGNSLTVQAGGATAAATDKDAGQLVLSPGASTGTGRASTAIKGYTTATATGTADNTQLDRAIFGAFKALTNNSAIAIVSATLANGSTHASQYHYAAEVTDGTDYQIEEGMVSCHVTNKAGIIANNTCVKYGNQQAMTAGTLTVTFAISAANPAVISVNANSSLIPSTGYPRLTYAKSNLTYQAVALQ